ncbi:MAG: hypothetical protein LBF12_04605, partial [Christensenellaceae bacterium]|nr:hypothetical protein [Christensenellaceae bacterium]
EGFTNENIDTVYIPDIVSNITNNTFAHSEVLIVTSYESKPEGWEDGWNGDNEVEWGAEL